jgi:hypothetical protein
MSPVLEPFDAEMTREVEEHAAPDDAVARRLDPVLRGALAGHQPDVAVVVHLAVVEDVGEGVPLRAALERHRDRVVRITKAARKMILGPAERVAAVGHHHVDRIEAAAGARLRPVLVEGQGARDDLAAPRQRRRREDAARRDEVERAPLVLGPETAPGRITSPPFADRILIELGLHRAGLLYFVRRSAASTRATSSGTSTGTLVQPRTSATRMWWPISRARSCSSSSACSAAVRGQRTKSSRKALR